MKRKNNHQALIMACVVAFLFIVIAGTGMRFGYKYIEKQLLLRNQEDAVDVGTIIGNNFSITDEEVTYLKSLTFNEMETDPINLRLMDTISGLKLRDRISNVYIMTLLDEKEIKYTVDESNSDSLGFDVGTELNGIWLLNGKFDENGEFQAAERDDIYRYLEFCDSDKAIFDSRSSFGLTTHDVWGDFVTGYIPVYSVEGTYVGILGVDMDMNIYSANVTQMTTALFMVCAVSMLALLALLVLAFWRYVKTKKGLVDAAEMYLDIVEKENKQKEQMLQRYKEDLRLRNEMFTKASLAVEINVTQGILVGMTGGEATFTEVNVWNNCPYTEYYDYVVNLTEDDYKKEIEKLSAANMQKRFEEGESRIRIEFLGRGTTTAPKLYYRSSCFLSINPVTNNLMAFVYTENIDEAVKYRKAIEQSMEEGMESIAIIHAVDGVAKLIKNSKRMKYNTVGKIFKYDDMFVKKSSLAVIPEEQALSYQKGLLTTVLSNLDRNNTYTYRITLAQRIDGLKHIQFQFRYLDKQKEDIVFCILDVTDIYEEEQKQKQALQTALNDARKANEITNGFMSRMSHDMRTPMNGILGVAELSKDVTTISELRESIATIKDSGQYLLGLINDTLDYQKIQSGKLILSEKIVDTREVVKNICDMVKVTADVKGVAFEAKLNTVDVDWYIRTDAMRLKQIFVNLLSNAIKFTAPGGKVEWEVSLLSREGNISHDILVVRDTGIGMSKEFLENDIFKPFSQEYNDYSEQYAGSGLGLSIVKSLVELMGGRIEVESELGEGSVFSVYLDFDRVEKITPELESGQQNLDDPQYEHLSGKKIILAEDHPLNAKIAKCLLEKKGCIVTHASNGQIAVDIFNKSQENTFDAVLMDIRMPVMDGMEATKAIRKLDREDAKSIPIIAITANAFEEDIKQCRAVGMNAHIGKPVEPQVLYATLDQCIRD